MELRLEGVSKTYPNGTRALADVTLTIPHGMFGLLGPNGAGKSTLMRSLATLQEVDAGTMRFGDIDIRTDQQRLREVLGYLPQDFGVYPKVTAWDMLDHLAQLKGLANRAERHEAVQALLHRTNLWEHARRRLGAFSGGMKQRFGIAQALLGDPKLIIVDEPTAGLDPSERLRFNNMLSEIGENVVVILSTHIVEDVSDLCRRMAIIAGGRLLLTGDPQSAIEGLRGRIWKKVVERGRLEDYEKEMVVISTRLVAGRTAIHVVAADRPDPSFVEVPPDLEDVYFSTLRTSERKAA